jgi:hypothetical protein
VCSHEAKQQRLRFGGKPTYRFPRRQEWTMLVVW